MRPDHVRDLSKVLFLDIETVPEVYHWNKLDPVMQDLWSAKTRYRQESQGKSAEDLYTEAGIFAEFGKIICIGVGRLEKKDDGHHLRVTAYRDSDEAAVLRQFVELLDKHYDTPDHWLCGHNGKEFDFPYIARRCIVNRIRLPKLLDIGGLKRWEVGHLDTMNMWSFGDRKNFTSLALLAQVLDIPTPKDDISGADVARVYYEENDLERIAKYCCKDVVATAQLYLRLRGNKLMPETHITIV